VVVMNTVKFCHCSLCLFLSSMSIVVPRAIREENDSGSENQHPDEADSHGDSPGPCICACFCSIVYTVCDEDSESNEELVCALKS
jgi:hypothetical protein